MDQRDLAPPPLLTERAGRLCPGNLWFFPFFQNRLRSLLYPAQLFPGHLLRHSVDGLGLMDVPKQHPHTAGLPRLLGRSFFLSGQILPELLIGPPGLLRQKLHQLLCALLFFLRFSLPFFLVFPEQALRVLKGLQAVPSHISFCGRYFPGDGPWTFLYRLVDFQSLEILLVDLADLTQQLPGRFLFGCPGRQRTFLRQIKRSSLLSGLVYHLQGRLLSGLPGQGRAECLPQNFLPDRFLRLLRCLTPNLSFSGFLHFPGACRRIWFPVRSLPFQKHRLGRFHPAAPQRLPLFQQSGICPLFCGAFRFSGRLDDPENLAAFPVFLTGRFQILFRRPVKPFPPFLYPADQFLYGSFRRDLL